MSNVLLVNVTQHESRVGLVENGVVAELYIERSKDRSIIGNIYKGKVIRVLPGMQAAFVDIGLDRAAFLYVSDVHEDMKNLYFGEEADDEDFEQEDEEATLASLEEVKQQAPNKIQDLLQEGQEIIVQVSKAPLGTKGARLTSHISLPGRNLVLVPTLDHIGISRKITDEKERARLRNLVEELRPNHYGFIVRTVAEGKKKQALREDMDYLVKVWEEIRSRKDKQKAPSLLHKDLSLILRAARDLFTPDIDRLIIDDANEHNHIKNFIEAYLPKLKTSLELYQGNEPLFDAFNIEADIARALGRKIWLKSGGYIIIDQMEALTAIDVNTGRFVGKRNLEDTILKTNLEAVREIATQLRLRNIGGIIIIDFIDMTKRTNRELVYNSFEEALKKDRARTNILKISDLGLVEMTRKRTQDSLVRYLCTPCPYCEGKAYIKSPITVCFEVLRNLKREAASDRKHKEILLRVHPEVADLLADEERRTLEEIEKLLSCKIAIKSKKNFHLEQFEIEDK